MPKNLEEKPKVKPVLTVRGAYTYAHTLIGKGILSTKNSKSKMKSR